MGGRGAYGVFFVWALGVAILACPPALASADPEGGQGGERMHSGLLTSTLVVDADRSGRFWVRSKSTVRVAADDRLTEKLIRESLLGEAEDHEWLGSGLRLFDDNRFRWAPGEGDLEDGIFTASTIDKAQEAVGIYAEVDPFFVDWEDGLTIRSMTPQPDAKAKWRVTIELDEVEVVDADPLPADRVREGSRTLVTWSFAPGEAEQVELELEPPMAVGLTADLVEDWEGLHALVSLLLGAAFVPALWLLLGRRRPSGESLSEQALRRQVSWLVGALICAAFTLVAEVTKRRLHWGEFPSLGWSLEVLAFDPLPLLFAVLFAAAIQGASRSPGSSWRVLGPALASALLLVASVLLAPSEGLERPFEWESASTTFAFGVAGWSILVFLVVNGLLRIAAGWIGKPGLSSRASRTLALASVPVVAALAFASWAAYSELDVVQNANVAISITVINLIHGAAGLLPLAILPGALAVLSRSSDGEPFLVRRRRLLWLALVLYLFFVVTGTGMFAGLPSPWSLLIGAATLGALALIRRARLERVDAELAATNPGGTAPGRSPLIEGKRELLERAFVVERVRRLRAAAHRKMAKAELAGLGFVSYRDSLAELDDAERYLQDGVPPAGRAPSAADRQLIRLRFPARPRLVVAALGGGPGRSWRENGEVALYFGARLAILPIAYVILVLVGEEFGSVFDPYYGFELIGVGTLLASELALWLVAAYVFGCLFSWLPGANGPLKGLALSLPVLAGLGLLELCPLYAGIDNWGFRWVQIFTFLTVLGLVMDWRTLRATGLRLRDLPDLYQVRSLRFGIVNLAPLLLSALAIYQQFRAGDPQGAVEETLRAASRQLPGPDKDD